MDEYQILKTQHEGWQVRIGKTTSLCKTGYSKFNQRWSLANQNQLNEPVYGYEQALEHANEYLAISDEYTEARGKERISIVKIITIEEIITVVQEKVN